MNTTATLPTSVVEPDPFGLVVTLVLELATEEPEAASRLALRCREHARILEGQRTGRGRGHQAVADWLEDALAR